MPRSLALSALLAAALPASAGETSPSGRPEQVVIVSFDGAHDNAVWAYTRDLAHRTGAQFTYFLSCTFLIPRERRHDYRGPDGTPGRSNVGFAETAGEVRARLGHIWAARAEGHDIASHACGHFDGGSWSAAEWELEFSEFRRTLAGAWHENGFGDEEPAGWAAFARDEVEGFRAPYLSTGPGLYRALGKSGYRYDASAVSRMPEAPDLDGRIARFALPMMAEGPRGKPVIAMDYNLFARHSRAVETPERSVEFEERAYLAFRALFDTEHDGARRPVQLGFHFTGMNGGAYWRALDRLLSEVCRMPDVACLSYREALDRAEAMSKRQS